MGSGRAGLGRRKGVHGGRTTAAVMAMAGRGGSVPRRALSFL